MKDENGKEIYGYDFDKLIEEYTNITKSKEPEHVDNKKRNSVSSSSSKKTPSTEKKKFVVHIDENLVNEPEDEISKSSSGGIYFSNYQRKRPVQEQRQSQNMKYGQVESNQQRRPSNSNIAKRPTQSAQRKPQNYNAAKNTPTKQKKGAMGKFNDKIQSIGGQAATAFLAFILLSTIALSLIGISCINDMLAINRSEENVMVTVPEGATYKDVLDILNDNGLISQKLFCSLFANYRGFSDETYLSGVYYLNSKMGVEGMLKDMMAAPVSADTVQLSFPEGWTIQQIFEKLEKYDVCDSSKLYTAIKNADFGYDFTGKIQANDSRYLKLEGYFFPDTYDFYVGADTNYVIKKFLGNFQDKWTDEYNAKAEKLGYTMDQIITIASIIQKEAADSSQMKTIASIIYNRLEDSAYYPTLGCDSTAIYISNYVTPIIGEAQGSFYYNKYDTSAVKGLPPGPICNPGIDAIKAALYPDDTNYYFFAHDNSGKIYLAETYKEHKNNLVLIIQANNSN